MFDTGHADALMMFTIPEGNDFLVAHRQNGQLALIGAVGMVQICLEQLTQQCLDAEFKCFQQPQEDIEALTSQAILKSTSTPSPSAEEFCEPLAFRSTSTGAPTSKRARLNIVLLCCVDCCPLLTE